MSSLLLCDRALVTPVPPAGAMPSFTESDALSAGWMWRIPLSQRFGCGYVYSSRFIEEQAAEEEFMRHAGAAGSPTVLRTIRMRVGRRTAPWTANCVAIGLAAGFLEPLESTGLYLVQKGVELLLDHFPDQTLEPALAAEYNRRLAAEFDHVRDFLLLHYRLNDRAGASDPTGFWTASREAATSPSLDRTLEIYDRTGLVDWEGQALFGDPSFYAIAAGFDRLPRTYHPMADQVDGEKAREALRRISAQNATVADALPDHAELIRAVHAARRA
jgi:tryptophan halogenase